MGCGCKGAGTPPPPPPQTTQTPGQSSRMSNISQQPTLQESIRNVVQKYYNKGR
jgi:hypothetical protein